MSNPLKSVGSYLKNVAQSAGGLVAAVVPIFEEEAETLVKTEAAAYLPAAQAAEVEAVANAAIVEAGAKAEALTVIPASTQAVTSPSPVAAAPVATATAAKTA
jgi:hypothetical protein